MVEQAFNGVLRGVGFAGSLRRGSFNRALVEAARPLAPAGRSAADGEAGRLNGGVAEPDRHRARPAASPAAPRPRTRAHAAAPRAPGGDGPRALRSGAPAHARSHAAGSRGVA